MKYKDLLPLTREELRELINDGIIQVNEEIDLNKNVDEQSFKVKMSLLEQLNNYYNKKARKDFNDKKNRNK